jgi:hypothetical protein
MQVFKSWVTVHGEVQIIHTLGRGHAVLVEKGRPVDKGVKLLVEILNQNGYYPRYPEYKEPYLYFRGLN